MITRNKLNKARILLASIQQEICAKRVLDSFNISMVANDLKCVSDLLTPESDFAPGDWVVRKRDMGTMKPALVTHVEFDPLVEQFKVWFTAPEKGNTRNAYQYELEAVAAPKREPATLGGQR